MRRMRPWGNPWPYVQKLHRTCRGSCRSSAVVPQVSACHLFRVLLEARKQVFSGPKGFPGSQLSWWVLVCQLWVCPTCARVCDWKCWKHEFHGKLLLRKACAQHSNPVQASLHPLSLVENSTQNKYGKWLLSTFMGSGTDNRVDSWSHLTFSLIVLWTISR